MFAPDVVNLRQFYATPLGEASRALIERGIHALWPEISGDVLLGVGFATPYMAAYVNDRTPPLVCMPAAQGAMYWPPFKRNLTFLAQESELPLRENSVNRVLMVHSVEHSEQLSWMMREVWRVLTPGGRVLVVAPNRLNFWSRSPRSPFGYGRPFSMAQLRDLLTDQQFAPTRARSALFTPPLYWRWLWRISDKIETVGKFLFRPFGGVLLIEAEKQLFAAIQQPVMARKSYRAPVAAAKPAMSRQ